jgi:hypothetical protein
LGDGLKLEQALSNNENSKAATNTKLRNGDTE